MIVNAAFKHESVLSPQVILPDNNIVSVNYHLTKSCNYSCRFCFSKFSEINTSLTFEKQTSLIHLLSDSGVSKINFAGGEPTIYHHLGKLITTAKRLNMTTSVVSNGYRLRELILEYGDYLDWIGLSIDSADENINIKLGRGNGNHISNCLTIAGIAREMGIRIKLNTVVSSLTWQTSMAEIVRIIQPDRWKVFEVLKIRGQNCSTVNNLLVTYEQFNDFIRNHKCLESEGFPMTVERESDILGSYIMIDPMGRFFEDITGEHVYSDSILKIGVQKAFQQIGFDFKKFIKRGGLYKWGN